MLPRAARGRLWLALGAGVVAALTACAAIVGINDRIPLDAPIDGTTEAPVTEGGSEGCPRSATCVKVPPGWTLVAFDRTHQAPCASGYGDPKDLETVEADCTCVCTQLAPARCSSDPINLRSYPNETCSNSVGVPFPVADGGCQKQTFTASSPGSGRLFGSPVAASCDGGVGAPPIVTKARACASLGVACGGGGGVPEGICAENLTKGLEQCVTHPGQEVCPPGFASLSRAGTSANDTRACGGCSCQGSVPTNCGEEELKIFRDDACNKDPVAINYGCTVLDGGTYESYQFRRPKLPSCAPTSPSLLTDGGVTFQDAFTVCCARGTGVGDGG